MRRMEKRREEKRTKILFYTALLGILRVLLEIIATILKNLRD